MVYDILPSENLEYSDIRDTLAAGGGSVNNDVASAFKESANINVWSKHKPVKYSDPFVDSDKRWQAWDGLCGFVINRFSYYQAVINDYDNAIDIPWLYDLPEGNSFPYRLGDFRGYFKNAKNIISDVIIQVTGPANNSNSEVSMFIKKRAVSENEENQSIKFGDIINSSSISNDLYLGLILVDNDGNPIKRLTTSENFVDVMNSTEKLGTTVKCSIYNMNAGNYKVYPFLSSVILTENGSDVDGSYYSLPINTNDDKFSIIIQSTDTTIILKGIIKQSEGAKTVEYTCDVKNISSEAISYNNNASFVRLFNKDYYDPLVEGEKQYYEDDITVQPQETKRLCSRSYNLPSNMFTCKLWVSLQGTKYIESAVPLMES